MANKPKSSREWIKNPHDYRETDRRDDIITPASQVLLFQEVSIEKHPDNIVIDEHHPIVETDSELPERVKHLIGEEVYLLYLDEYSKNNKDYEHSEFFKTKLVDI
jgi:hypothetical protein